MTQVPL